MWQIVNTTNKDILDIFKKEISDKIFYMLLDISKKLELKIITIKSNDYENWKRSIIYKKSAQKNLFNYIFKCKVKNTVFDQLFTLILKKYTRSEILDYYNVYIEQNKNVYNLNYNIPVKECHEFKFMFVEFFYNEFFNDELIWTNLIGEAFDRRKFHDNFKKDNNNLFVCPYCDIDTTISKSNNYVEHFLPKAKYPFLSMNALNLASSCSACNKAEEGKGENVKSPIVSPYNVQIGDLVSFSIDEPNKKIVMENNYKIDDSIQNYLDLLHLKDKYSEERVFIIVTNKVQSILENMPFLKTPDEDFLTYLDKKYLERFKGKEPLTIAIKSILTL